MTYRGHVKNGVVVLDAAVALPEGAAVEVRVVEGRTEEPPLSAILLKYAGKAEGLPPDLAENHDHYLYGVPKK